MLPKSCLYEIQFQNPVWMTKITQIHNNKNKKNNNDNNENDSAK